MDGWRRRACSVAEAVFREQRLLSLHTRNSAAYKGIYALLMRNGSLDWMKNQPMSLAPFFNYQVDIHHIFPKAWCVKNGIEHSRQESIVNKTAIGRVTNIKIGGRSPVQYLKTIEVDAGLTGAQLDDILRSHEIDPISLRQGSFDAFFANRTEALLSMIESAMGKAAIPQPELMKRRTHSKRIRSPRRKIRPSRTWEPLSPTMLLRWI